MGAADRGAADGGGASEGAALPAEHSDLRLVERLRSGDEAAFVALVERYHPALMRVAQIYVSSRAVAEEIVQETWVGVIQGLGRFEGRSSLKTWIFRILTNRARTRREREGRSVPFSALPDFAADADEPAVDPQRFYPPDHPRWPGRWIAPPRSWEDVPEQRFLAQETRERIRAAIAALPASQRAVITLRDIEGWSSEEVCGVLGISETNQRVLLHRARAKVRRALEEYLSEA